MVKIADPNAGREKDVLWAEWSDTLECPALHACPEPHHLVVITSLEGLPIGFTLAFQVKDKEGNVIKTATLDLGFPMIAELVAAMGDLGIGIMPNGHMFDLEELKRAALAAAMPDSKGMIQ